jgi:hypothetical protein
MATVVNQHPPVHHQGWMICDQETVFCWVAVPELTMVVSSVGVGFILFLKLKIKNEEFYFLNKKRIARCYNRFQ